MVWVWLTGTVCTVQPTSMGCCSSAAAGREDSDSPRPRLGCCLCCSRGDEEGRKRKKRNQERKKQENDEQRQASAAASQFCERDHIRVKYSLEDDGRSRNIGSRLQKYWFVLQELPLEQPQEEVDSGVASPSESPDSDDITPAEPQTPTPKSAAKSAAKPQRALLSISPLPSGYPLELDDKTVAKLNHILEVVQKHPFIHPVKKLEYLKEEKKVAVIQTFHTDKGSLRDVIFGETPYRPKSWSKKYAPDKTPQPFATDQIALFGRQILEAMVFLREVGFKALGHVHTGNIFIAVTSDNQEVCQLGGYEQTLLGYRTMLYREIHRMKLLKYIDIIMFGHVIYEMSTGRALTGVCLTREEYQIVEDKSIRTVLKEIFELNTSLEKLLREQEFFQAQVVASEFEREALTKKRKRILKNVGQLYKVEGSGILKKLFSQRSTITGLSESFEDEVTDS